MAKENMLCIQWYSSHPEKSKSSHSNNMDEPGIILKEISQTEKDRYMISLPWSHKGKRKSQTQKQSV